MKVKETKLQGCFIIEPKVFEDKRGYFFESYNQNSFDHHVSKTVKFVQDNESYSTKGVLRGLHFQTGKYAQAKLVRVVQGSVLDVAVDLRKNSKTYGKYISVELSHHNKKQLFVPRGFAHGFVVLSDVAVFSYKCDNYYNKEFESGIIYNDVTLNIDWQLSDNELIVSEKDMLLPKFQDLKI
ncbi:MAG: dTDP-4-dehydrorhamnose 3,5-epimerase [Psychroserpens sp.]|nr:dTDP-4-dehydrorhamnose 3,5-epimerase [Psychroserpens sp.]